MDIQLADGRHGVVHYVCKYVAKHEPFDLKTKIQKTVINDAKMAKNK